MSNRLSKGDKVALGLAGIGAAGLLGYGIYYNLTGGAVVSQCEAQQGVIFNQWISTLETYLTQNSASGIALTQEQTSNLNTILAAANAQQQVCINAAKKLNQSITDIIGNATVVVAIAIASAIIIYGLSKAYKSIKNAKPPQPPSSGGGMTWAEAAAFMTPIIVQQLYSDGKISLDEAEAMSGVAVNTLSPDLYESTQNQVSYFEQIDLFTTEEVTAYLSVAETAILSDMEIISIVVLA